jgi:hypothetical protein
VASFEVNAETKKSPEEVFGLLADLTNATGWDPSVIAVERTTEGPLGIGAQFTVTLGFLGLEKSLVYEIVEFTPPERLVLTSSTSFLVSTDTITVVARNEGGSTVRYQATLDGQGLVKWAEPLLNAVITYLGSGAKPGLLKMLG